MNSDTWGIYKWVILGCLAVVAMVAFPSIKTAMDASPTSGFSTLTSAAHTFLPYALLGTIIFLAYKTIRGRGND